MSAQLSFDMMCHRQAPSPPRFPFSNWPVVVPSKLGMMGNVVCTFSLLISLPALTIHNGTLAVTVTWCCHLVLHTSAQISRQATVLTNRDFTLSNKSVPQRRLLIGLTLWHCCWYLWEEDGTSLKTFSANSCWQFRGCLWQECCCALVLRLFFFFFQANLAIFTPSPFIPITYHVSESLQYSGALYHGMPLQPFMWPCFVWFWYLSCRIEAQTTRSLKHLDHKPGWVKTG